MAKADIKRFQFFDFSAGIEVADSPELIEQSISVCISGLFSTDGIDRDGSEVSDPLEFDIPAFMASGRTLLLDHNFIVDPITRTNSVAGVVDTAVPVFISGFNPENELQYEFTSLIDGSFVSFFDVDRIPDLSVGSKGVFVKARVTHPIAIQKVLAGELRAFSWRGFADTVSNQNGVTQLRDIDLVEVSIVHTPSRRSAVFRMLEEGHPDRELEFKDVDFVKVGFDKRKYNINTIKEYTKNLSINTQIEETSDSYYINIGNPSLVDLERSFAIPVNGRTVIAAPKIKNTSNTFSVVGKLQSTLVKEPDMSDTLETKVEVAKNQEPQKLYLLDAETLLKKFPNTKIIHNKSIVLEDIPVDLETVEFDFADFEVDSVVETDVVVEATEVTAVVETENEAVVKTEVEQAETVVAEQPETVVPETSATVETTEKSRLDVIETALAKILENMTQEKPASEQKTQDMEKLVAEQVAVELAKRLKSIEATQTATESQRDKLQRMLNRFETITPVQTTRDENRVETAKSFDLDKFSVFDMFPNLTVKKGA